MQVGRQVFGHKRRELSKVGGDRCLGLKEGRGGVFCRERT